VTVAVAVIAVIGLLTSLSGAVGVLRLPDVYTRVQASSKSVTLGAVPALIAVVIGEGPYSSYGSRALIVAVLILAINPAASHALLRAAWKTGVPQWHDAVGARTAKEAANEGPS
jgi:multicomponent Na+:H+ antiporter subunit G